MAIKFKTVADNIHNICFTSALSSNTTHHHATLFQLAGINITASLKQHSVGINITASLKQHSVCKTHSKSHFNLHDQKHGTTPNMICTKHPLYYFFSGTYTQENTELSLKKWLCTYWISELVLRNYKYDSISHLTFQFFTTPLDFVNTLPLFPPWSSTQTELTHFQYNWIGQIWLAIVMHNAHINTSLLLQCSQWPNISWILLIFSLQLNLECLEGRQVAIKQLSLIKTWLKQTQHLKYIPGIFNIASLCFPFTKLLYKWRNNTYWASI